MKALVLVAKNTFEYKEVQQPAIDADDVLIEVKACGICGSDVHGMDGSSGRRIPPLIMGHEAAGVIHSRGDKVKDWQVGDRVTFDSTIYPLDDWFTKKGLYNLADNRKVLGVSCADYKRDGAMAQYLAVPAHILHRIPDDLSFNHAALAEPVSVAIHAINISLKGNEDSAMVVGCGVIGLFIVQLLKSKNVPDIIAIDIQDDRLHLAGEAGASYCLNANDKNIEDTLRNFTSARGAVIVYEAVGLESTVNLAIDSVRKGGTVVLVGNITSHINFPLQKVVTRQINIQGSCAICGEYPQALEMLQKRTIDADKMISAIAPLPDGAQWFDKLYKNNSGLIKVILNP